MEIISITGPMYHGKSTLAQAFVNVDPAIPTTESSIVITKAANYLNRSLGKIHRDRFADCSTAVANWLDAALPTAVEAATVLPFRKSSLQFGVKDLLQNGNDQFSKLHAYLNAVEEKPSMMDQTINPENKADYRHLLQWLGGFVTNRLGYSLWYREIMKQAQAAEAEGRSAFIVGGLRFPVDEAEIRKSPNATVVEITMPGKPISDIDDPTEALRKLIKVDTHVVNNGSIDQLRKIAARLLVDIPNKQLREYYIGRAFPEI